MAYIASIGFFDGVHKGHLSLIHQLQDKADELEQPCMLITFISHPRLVIEGTSPQLLLTHDERIKRLQQTGVDCVLELDFATIQTYTAEQFMRFIHEQYGVSALLLGYDHRFGSDRLSRFSDYQLAGAKVGIDVYLAEQAHEGAISSTKIRRALAEGRLEEANAFLGYNYSLVGTVVHGQHIGTQLGFPTANLQPALYTQLPKLGVYAAVVNGHQALVNIGTNPTFGSSNPVSIEVHIPHFEGNLYDQTLHVELLSYMREDKRFDNPQALIEQILQDLSSLAHILQ